MKLYFFKTKFYISFFALLCLSSCLKIAFTKAHILEKNVSVKYITNGNTKIVFIPMHHIGVKEFYTDAKNKIDYYITSGYLVYFEGVKMGEVKDSLQKDSILRKTRKVTGVDFVAASKTNGYLDTINNTILGKKFRGLSKYKLVNQPKGIVNKSDSLKYKNVDATYVQIIAASENKFGPIILNDYDIKTNFGEKYKSKKNKEMKKYFLADFRNNLIADSILKKGNHKIVLLFGAKHFDGILENLKKSDKEYKEVDKL